MVSGVGERDGFPTLRRDTGETDTAGEARDDSDGLVCAGEEPELNKSEQRTPERNNCRS